MKKIITIVALVALSACTNVDKTVSTLTAAGYTNITTQGYDWWLCGEDDTFHTKFTATGPTGLKVSGAVCSGVFKGNTVRFD